MDVVIEGLDDLSVVFTLLNVFTVRILKKEFLNLCRFCPEAKTQEREMVVLLRGDVQKKLVILSPLRMNPSTPAPA